MTPEQRYDRLQALMAEEWKRSTDGGQSVRALARLVEDVESEILWCAWQRIATAMNAMDGHGSASAWHCAGMDHALLILKRMGALAREGAPADARMVEEIAAIRARWKE